MNFATLKRNAAYISSDNCSAFSASRCDRSLNSGEWVRMPSPETAFNQFNMFSLFILDEVPEHFFPYDSADKFTAVREWL